MTVQIDIDEKILAEVDENLRVLNQSRDEYFRQGIMDLAAKLRCRAEIARQYAEAYGKHPQMKEEVEEWEEVQHWEDE